MLEPGIRSLLFDILRPPENHTLDCGIATTYTLDLLALLTAPVAFSLFEADDHRELLKQNSLTLLESLRRYADRLTVFTQAGLIALPKAQFPQFEFLERVVVECQAAVPKSRFHPKVWILRFVGPEDSVRYRFACLSRNLTFDRCWDTVLTLEGPLTERRNAIAVNHPLADFVGALPALCVRRPVDQVVVDRVERIQAEVRRVSFDLPEGFESYRFHPMGLAARRTLPFDEVPGRMLAVSPFISEEGLKRIFKGRSGSVLVSREESLADGRCRAPEVDRYYVMRDSIETEECSETEDQPPTARGLHAKCYIAEAGSKAHIWTGSANATSAGFNGNVEFLVELVGSKSKVGIESLFEKVNGRAGFGDMLDAFSESRDSPRPDDEERDFAVAVDGVRLALVGRVEAAVEAAADGYVLRLRSSDDILLPDDVVVTCWPVTLGAGYARSVSSGPFEQSFSVALESISSFFAFRVAKAKEGEPREETFVFNIPLTGVPADRRERLLRSVIQDRDRFVRYLLLLLSGEGLELADQMDAENRASGKGADARRSDGLEGLLESLLRTLHDEPERLDHVARLVEDLKNQPDAGQLLPDRFDEVWAPIWTVRQRERNA